MTTVAEIIMSIHVCLIQRMNFDSKENGERKRFSYETKAPIACIPMRKTCTWWPVIKILEIIMSIHVCLIR